MSSLTLSAANAPLLKRCSWSSSCKVIPPLLQLHGCRRRLRAHAALRGLDGSSSALGKRLHGQHRERRNKAPAQVCQCQRETFPGVYGEWSLEDSDKAEVLLYRAALNATCFSLALASLPALLPGLNPQSLQDLSSSGLLPPPLPPLPLDFFFWSGSAALGLTLTLIHIYVTPIKRTLQGLWAAGVAGALLLSWSIKGQDLASPSLVLYVLDHPSAIWAVGPEFAALTGLAFKEGLCYGKLEAAALFFVIPSLLLGHLSGLLSVDVEKALLALWVLLSLVFALRKFTQPIKDDIGDKSVFLFQALTPPQQQELLARLQAPKEESL